MESVLLKVLKDLLVAADFGQSSILVLLDLSVAFDTIDNAILLEILRNCVGIQGSALEWFKSYLSDRSFSVEIGKSSSSSVPLNCGVPQGSILGLLLFSLCLLPLGHIFLKYNIPYNFYADDTQVYFPLNHNDNYNILSLLNCLTEVRSWLTANFLTLNASKS